jgi:hypothetical protein
VFRGAGDITVATWIKVTSFAGFQRIFDLGVDAKLTQNQQTGTAYLTFVLDDPFNSGEHSFSSTKDGYTNAGKIATSSGSIPGNLWEHVAVTLAAGTATVYIDGMSIGTRTSVLSPKDIGTVDYAFIGRSQFANDPYLDGLIDEFWVYDRALSGAEVNALYAAAAP